jgi:hypothetical protein
VTPSAIGAAPASHTQAASTISDSTTAGRALLTGSDAAAQRTSLGLGTAATQADSRYAPEWIEVALTSPGAVLAAATTFYADLPYAATLTAFRLACQVAPTASAAVVDLKRNAAWGSTPTSILNTTLSLAAGSYEVSTTSFATTSLTADDVLAVYVSSADSGATASGCVATISLTR